LLRGDLNPPGWHPSAAFFCVFAAAPCRSVQRASPTQPAASELTARACHSPYSCRPYFGLLHFSRADGISTLILLGSLGTDCRVNVDSVRANWAVSGVNYPAQPSQQQPYPRANSPARHGRPNAIGRFLMVSLFSGSVSQCKSRLDGSEQRRQAIRCDSLPDLPCFQAGHTWN